jgi:adenylosuccinate lyase
VRVEVEWLLCLAARADLPEVPALDAAQQATVRAIADHFDTTAAARVKAIEARTRHDVKAVEYYLGEQLTAQGLGAFVSFLHVCLTSEDVNNLAYALMMRDGVRGPWRSRADALVEAATRMAIATRDLPMLALTHGQPATPTTLGKEVAVFVGRWRRQLAHLDRQEFLGKCNGATGTFGAHVAAWPGAAWEEISRGFVEGLGLTYAPLTTQIEPHDWIAEVAHGLIRFGQVTLDFCRDMWTYISRGVLKQRVVAGEVGSSTMPHKVNPIDFENAEANVGIAAALLDHLALKLTTSRLQRDLSDSSALRNLGSAIGYSAVALASAARGLGRVAPDEAAMASELDAHWEVLAEPIQTVLRVHGITEAYEQLKVLTRGTHVTAADIAIAVDGLPLPADVRARLAGLTPSTYVGIASRLVDHATGAGDRG